LYKGKTVRNKLEKQPKVGEDMRTVKEEPNIRQERAKSGEAHQNSLQLSASSNSRSRFIRLRDSRVSKTQGMIAK
jgi:hypothetical protein